MMNPFEKFFQDPWNLEDYDRQLEKMSNNSTTKVSILKYIKNLFKKENNSRYSSF